MSLPRRIDREPMLGDYKNLRKGRGEMARGYPSFLIPRSSYNRKAAVNLESREREEEGSRRVIKAQTSLIPGSCAKGRWRRRAGAEGTRNESEKGWNEKGKRGRSSPRCLSSFRYPVRQRLTAPLLDEDHRLSYRIRTVVARSRGLRATNLSYRDMLKWPLVRSKKSDATNDSKLSSRRGVAFLRAIQVSRKLSHTRYISLIH